MENKLTEFSVKVISFPGASMKLLCRSSEDPCQKHTKFIFLSVPGVRWSWYSLRNHTFDMLLVSSSNWWFFTELFCDRSSHLHLRKRIYSGNNNWYLECPSVKFIPSAHIAKPVRTKGSIGVCFRLYQRMIIIIASHLSRKLLFLLKIQQIICKFAPKVYIFQKYIFFRRTYSWSTCGLP